MINYIFILVALFQVSSLALAAEIEGYRILDSQEGSVFEQVGLQKMDVIKSANGEPVDSIQKAMELYNTVKLKNKVKWQVERDGKSKNLEYVNEHGIRNETGNENK